jgi:hypothetical protein
MKIGDHPILILLIYFQHNQPCKFLRWEQHLCYSLWEFEFCSEIYVKTVTSINGNL